MASDFGGRLGVHEQCYDQPVQTQHFGENEDQNHSDEEFGLLGRATDTSVTDNTNSETWARRLAADRPRDWEE